MMKLKQKQNEPADAEQEWNPGKKKREIVTIDTYDRIDRQLRITKIVSVLLGIAMLTFLCLFVYQLSAEKRTYQKIYNESAARSAALMTELREDEFDYDTKYREITAELGVMCQMTYRMKADDQQQKAMNELYYAYIKLPNQVKLHFEELWDITTRIRDGDPTVYETLRTLIATFDKQDY